MALKLQSSELNDDQLRCVFLWFCLKSLAQRCQQFEPMLTYQDIAAEEISIVFQQLPSVEVHQATEAYDAVKSTIFFR